MFHVQTQYRNFLDKGSSIFMQMFAFTVMGAVRLPRNNGSSGGDGDVMLLVRATAALIPLVLLHICLFVAGEDAAETTPIDHARTSRFPRYRFNIRKDDIFHDTRVIPVEHQVSEFLYKGDTKL
jgi:hypothetical protein